MRVDFSQILIGYDDKPVQFPGGDGKGEEDLTLGRACCEAVTAMYQDEQPTLSGDDKALRNLLAMRIYKSTHNGDGAIELKAKDVVLLKEVVNKMFGTKIVGPAWALLEPEDVAAGK